MVEAQQTLPGERQCLTIWRTEPCQSHYKRYYY